MSSDPRWSQMNHSGGAFCGAALASAYAAVGEQDPIGDHAEPDAARSASDSDDHIQLFDDIVALRS